MKIKKNMEVAAKTMTKLEKFLIRNNALDAFKKNVEFNYEEHIADEGNETSGISSAFGWSGSPEGYNYWNSLDRLYRETFND